MSPESFLRDVYRPAQFWAKAAVPNLPQSPQADQFLMTVAGQESNWTHRAQILNGGGRGPAMGYWQFERGGGVKGVLLHKASAVQAALLCTAARIDVTMAAAWAALETHDGLAYGFARLLLLTDPPAIPVKPAEAWEAYCKRLWRPGKPHPEVWDGKWLAATKALAG